MPKFDRGFDVIDYGVEHHAQDRFAVIYQIVQDLNRESPVAGVRVSLSGNLVKLTYYSYEMLLQDPVRFKATEDAAKQLLNSALKEIKKQYKKQRKEEIELKERKDLSSYSIEKTSQNQRFMFASWRFYELGA